MGSDDKIRVVIVDDVAETRENIRRLLQFENDVEVVGVAGTGRDAIAVAKDVRPDVVLMDINMPDMDGIAATEAIRRSVYFTQIVVLSVQGDPNYMRRAMLAGARDFLTKPPSVDELTSAIRRAGKMAHEERAKAPVAAQVSGGAAHGATLNPVTTGKVVVVYSPKGGAGCTTVSVNLAMALHNEETPVILVDGNLQYGDVTVFLNEQGKNTITDLAPRADELDPEILEEVLITHKTSKVRILAAPTRPEYAESVTGEQFGKVLQYLKRMYSYIVVDTSSTLTDEVVAAIDAADLVILLTTQDIPAIKNARLFFDLANVLNLSPKRIVFAMNRFDKRIGITPEKVGESFKHEISAVLPMDERVVIPSINRGVPFILADKSKPISKAILQLAEEVRHRLTELEQIDEQKQDGKVLVGAASRVSRR
ncbi:MAG: AAA family ATPase [Anaerolineales bacterium]